MIFYGFSRYNYFSENKDFQVRVWPFPWIKWNVEIENSLEKKLGKIKNKDQITKEVALKVLKGIKRESDVKAFFSKPIVVFSMGVILTFFIVIALLVPCVVFKAMFGIQALFICIPIIVVLSIPLMVGFALVEMPIRNLCNGWLSELSLAYKQQSEDVKKDYIDEIQKCKNKEEFQKLRSNFFSKFIEKEQ